MDYQTIPLPSNVNDAFSGQTNTRSSYTTKIIPCFFRQGEQLALETILYPIDYTPDSAAIASILEWYPVNKLGLIHSMYISVVDTQFKPVVFNSGTVSVRLRYNGGVKFEDKMDWIQDLQGMEDIAKAFSHSTQDDPNMSQLKIQWKLDHEVQQAFKCLKIVLTTCIKVLGNVVDFKQKNAVTQTPSPVPVVEEPKEPMQEDQP